MSASQIVLRGQVKPDGTLELDQNPALPAGPVEVTIRPLPTPTPGGEDWWQFLQRSRRELEASGHRFRTKEEIDAEMVEIRTGDERLDEVYRQTEEQRRPG